MGLIPCCRQMSPAQRRRDNLVGFSTGWWFGTSILFSHILGISSSQLTFIFFRGVQTTNQSMVVVFLFQAIFSCVSWSPHGLHTHIELLAGGHQSSIRVQFFFFFKAMMWIAMAYKMALGCISNSHLISSYHPVIKQVKQGLLEKTHQLVQG